jgi:hypothetical protein
VEPHLSCENLVYLFFANTVSEVVDNINIELKEVSWEDALYLSGLEQGPVTSFLENGNEPLSSITFWEFLTSWTTISFPK